MPGFVKTPADEARWAKAKEAAGKETEKDSESYYKLSNYIYHKMGKSEEDQKLAKMFKTELYKAFSVKMPSINKGTGMPAPTKVGTQATVKNPKAKRMPDPWAKPSLFYKSENKQIKPSIEKLSTFLNNTKQRKQSSSV